MEKEKVQKAVKILENSSEFAELIPEVRSNIVMAIEDAKTIEPSRRHSWKDYNC